MAFIEKKPLRFFFPLLKKNWGARCAAVFSVFIFLLRLIGQLCAVDQELGDPADGFAALAALEQPAHPTPGQRGRQPTQPTPAPQGQNGLTPEEKRARAARTF